MVFKKYGLIFGFAVVLHGIVWVLLPTFLHPAYKPDIIEQMFAGREWVWATAKHPMLPAWLLETANLLTGRAFAAPFIVSQLCTIGTLIGIWLLSRSALPNRLAIVPPLILLPYWFFTIESTKYNQNIPLVFFWTLSISLVYFALKTDRLVFWIASGLAIGIGFHSKFTMLFLVVAILVFMTFDARTRRYWKTPGPYITTLFALLVFSPQLWWMLKHGIPGEKTAVLVEKSHLINHLLFPLMFAGAECPYLALPFLLLVPILGFSWKKRTNPPDEDQWAFHFLAAMIGVPFLLYLGISATLPLDLNPDYGAAIWPMTGVLVLLRFESKERIRFEQWAGLLFLGELLMIGCFVFQAVWSPMLTGKARGFQYPMQDLGPACERIWKEQGIPGHCPYVSGAWFLAGNAAQSMRPIPSVHAMGSTYNMDLDTPLSTWSTDDDVNRQGGLILWYAREGVPKTLFRHFPEAKILPEFELDFQTRAKVSPLRIGIAVVLPTSPRDNDRNSGSTLDPN